MANGSSTHNTKLIINPTRTRGKILLTQNVELIISAAVDRKSTSKVHLAAGNVYVGASAAALGTPTEGWKVPTNLPLEFQEGDIWAVTTDASATIYIWDE